MRISRKPTIGGLVIVPLLFFAAVMAGATGSMQWPPEDPGSLSSGAWAAAYTRYRATEPTFRAASPADFQELTRYFLAVVSKNDGTVVHTFHLTNDDLVHCVVVDSQPSYFGPRGLRASMPLRPTVEPKGVATASRMASSTSDVLSVSFGLDGTVDADGNARRCSPGSFPRLIPSLASMYRVRSLEEYFGKYPGGLKSLGVPRGVEASNGRSDPRVTGALPDGGSQVTGVRDGHEWAHALRRVGNGGSSARFNVWQPSVESFDFSLSQMWVSGGSGTDQQTAEAGWQVYPQKYGDSTGRLFIYFTTNGYTNPGSNLGCYNLDCNGFVQIDSSILLGGALSPVSTYGGAQYDLDVMVYRDPSVPHDWWLWAFGRWVGYYPNTLYDAQGIAEQSTIVDFGGEIYHPQNVSQTTPQMGSGHFPNEGFGKAAYTRLLQYFDTAGNTFNATGLTRNVNDWTGADASQYYDLSLQVSGDSNWSQYFYFGGPGRISLGPLAAFSSSPSDPQAGQAVSFVDTSTGFPSAWSWNFGDGSTSAQQNPTHTFAQPGQYSIGLTVSNSAGVNTVSRAMQVGGRGRACTPGATSLCLNNGRFAVQAIWTKADGASGSGQAVALTGDTGYLWFFSPNNVEVVIKVVDGRAVNSAFWVFAGGLTNVNVVITVTDTQTGAVRTYINRQGTAFQPIQDTSAFASAVSGGTTYGAIGVGAANEPKGSSGGIPRPRDLAVAPRESSARVTSTESAACIADAASLCLNGGRFRVQVTWAKPDGSSGAGQAVPVTGDTGYFWFFSSNNVEMVIKVVDGRPVNSRFWVFAGGLSNVRVLITVTDTQMGTVKTYLNSQGTAFAPIQGTSAFPGS